MFRDAAGNQTKTADSGGNVQTYAYDTAGRLRTVTRNGSQVASYEYGASNQRLISTDVNGTTWYAQNGPA